MDITNEIDFWQELDGVWFARYSFETGSIGATAQTKEQAIRDVIAQWRNMALPGRGKFSD